MIIVLFTIEFIEGFAISQSSFKSDQGYSRFLTRNCSFLVLKKQEKFVIYVYIERWHGFLDALPAVRFHSSRHEYDVLNFASSI